jgi:hypothetical protein
MRTRFVRWGVIPLLTLCVGLFGCRGSSTTPPKDEPSDEGPVWFEDVTEAVGLDFVHDPGPTGSYFMPQSMGSGCAFLHEFAPDGTETIYLYLLQDAGPDSRSVNRLYKRTPDGKFRDVTTGSGLDVTGYNMGVAVADVNNDGLPDVLLTQYGSVRLFLNRGNGQFEDVTKESGLSNPLWGMSAAFFDYDRDGWLDLVLVNYVDYDPKSPCPTPRGVKDFCGPQGFNGTCAKLFHNLGSTGGRVRFEDVSFASGLGKLPGPGLGVVCADFDGDGWPDIFVANDGKANRLWINGHNGTFVDQAARRGVAMTATGKEYAGMGVAIGDVENCGMLDLHVTHLGYETNTLWKQGPRGCFQDRTVEAGMTATRWRGTGFGTLMADFNNDGWLDIALVNGRVIGDGPAKNTGLGFWEPYAEHNQLLANDGAGKFRDVSPANKAFCAIWNVARGLACCDFDNDGAPDLVITSIGGRARLYRNVAPNRGHWLKVRAVIPVDYRGEKRVRDAYGAELRVRAGGTERLRVVNGAESYLSSSSPVAHFGLGKSARVDSIMVNWPDGKRELFDNSDVDRLVVLEKGKGRSP